MCRQQRGLYAWVATRIPVNKVLLRRQTVGPCNGLRDRGLTVLGNKSSKCLLTVNRVNANIVQDGV